MAAVKKVTVNPRDLCAGMVRLIAFDLNPDADSSRVPQLNLCRGLKVEVRKLWRTLGRQVSYSGNLQVTVPSMSDLVHDLRNSVAPERQRVYAELSARLAPWQPPVNAPDGALSANALLQALENADQNEYRQIMDLVFRLEAADGLFAGVCYLAAVERLEGYAKGVGMLNALQPELKQKSELEQLSEIIKFLPANQARQLSRMVHGAGGFQPFISFCRVFLDTQYWDRARLPSESALGLFPTLRERVGGLPDEPLTLDLKDKEVERDAERIDRQLFDFYTTQLDGCTVKVVETDGWFKEKQRDYVAFLVSTKSKKRVVVLEPVAGGNFAWLMIMNDMYAGWPSAAVKQQYRLFGPEAPLMRRFLHPRGWQKRLQNFIASLG